VLAATPRPRPGHEHGQALCGTDGCPSGSSMGRFSHAGDFLIPVCLFLYIAGTKLGWPAALT